MGSPPSRSPATCAKRSRPSSAAGFDGIEIFEQDFIADDGGPARGRPNAFATPGWRSCCSSRSAISRACRLTSRARAFDRAERKFDLMQETWTAISCWSARRCIPQALGRHRPGRRRFRGTWRAGRRARAARRLRGAGLGPSCQRPPRRLGDRAPRRSSECRSDPRQLPHAGAQDRPRTPSAASRATASSSFSWPTRRRSTWTCSTGRGISGTCRAKAIWRSTEFMRAVMATGYSGPVSLEIFNDQFRGPAARRTSPSTEIARWSI